MLNNYELNQNYEINSQTKEIEDADTSKKLKIILLGIVLIVGIVLSVFLISQNFISKNYEGENGQYQINLSLKNNGTFVLQEKSTSTQNIAKYKGNYSFDNNLLKLNFYDGRNLVCELTTAENGVTCINLSKPYPNLVITAN